MIINRPIIIITGYEDCFHDLTIDHAAFNRRKEVEGLLRRLSATARAPQTDGGPGPDLPSYPLVVRDLQFAIEAMAQSK